MKKSILVILSLYAWFTSQAQNVFHDRGFWSKKPTIAMIEAEIAKGNDITEMGPGGWDGPLLAIMADNDYDVIKHILDKPGIDVNVNTHHSQNYLMWTTMKGNLPVMELLVEKGSRTDIINSHGQSLLMHAAMAKPDKAVYDFCIANGGDIVNDKDEQGRNVMLSAVSGLTDVSFLDYFLSKGLSLNDTDKDGNGLFHYAVPAGNVSLLKGLVAKGVSVKPNKLGENAFAFVGRGRGAKLSVELLEYLKGLGLDPTLPNAQGRTLAHTAAQAGASEEIFKFLEDNNIDLGKPDDNDNTPLMAAASRGNVELLKRLLESNSVNFVNREGESALVNAVAYNSPEAVNLLLEAGSDVGIMSKGGDDLYGVLIESYRKGRNSIERVTELISLLEDNGLQMPLDGSLLHKAFKKDDEELLNLLIEKGIDINAKDKDGNTILHYAAMQAKDIALVERLIEKGADPEIRTEFDESILDLLKANEAIDLDQTNTDFLNR
ncbi:ankyrin repeat domain-containing protein [Jiulongibacter sediminis]|uniref:ankyrin repeat domain-containing protein n=1 Tax=Jiulongibacter sediminis TaxID=1605367 RepID=UPI0026F0B896|nr:ankyrin repeat domain-containing protein [Jiulongibacter sediminis]